MLSIQAWLWVFLGIALVVFTIRTARKGGTYTWLLVAIAAYLCVTAYVGLNVIKALGSP